MELYVVFVYGTLECTIIKLPIMSAIDITFTV